MDQKIRKQQLKGLRELLSWLNKHPEVDIPYWLTCEHRISGIDSQEDLAAMRRKLGACEKVVNDSEIGFRHEFSGGVKVRAVISRNEVCERVQTGTRRVEAYTYPAHEEPVYEYKCPESLLVALGEAS